MPLREDLDAAIKDSMFAGTYQRRIEELRRIHRHTIQVLPCNDITRFNCYAFATGVNNEPRYRALVDKAQSSALVNSTFIKRLIDDGVLKASAAPAPGSIVIYFNGDKIEHAARVLDDTTRLSSKWGAGDLHEHGLFEVPTSYGQETRFFAPSDTNEILKRLEEAHAGA